MEAITHSTTPRAFYPDGLDFAPANPATPSWDMGPERRIDDGQTLAKGLGWFSIGLGLAELIAPEQLAKFLGIDEKEHKGLIRFMGVREIASGVVTLIQREPKTGMWSRVAGDAIDMAALGAALKESDAKHRVGIAAGMVAGVAALDALATKQLHEHDRSKGEEGSR